MKQQTWVTSIEMYGQLLQFFGDGTVKRKKWVNMSHHLAILMYVP